MTSASCSVNCTIYRLVSCMAYFFQRCHLSAVLYFCLSRQEGKTFCFGISCIHDNTCECFHLEVFEKSKQQLSRGEAESLQAFGY